VSSALHLSEECIVRLTRSSSVHRPTTPRRAATLALTLALLLVAVAAPSVSVLAQSTTASGLQNADLEEGSEGVRGGHGTVAAGWSPWWIEGTAEQRAQGQLRPPTFAATTALRAAEGAHSGTRAQELASEYATHDGGIYQRVAVPPGSVVHFSMWVYVWSSSSDDTARSYKPGDYRVAVGIDPYGGTDGASAHVVWSPDITEYDHWIKLNVRAVAKANAITVFTRGACSWRVQHNTSTWDDASLSVVPATRSTTDASANSPTDGPASLSTLSATPLTEAYAIAEIPNVLQNPDFEEAFTERGAGELTIATGWHPWWVAGSEREVTEGYLFRPEYKPERRGKGRGRVHAMNAAQKQFNTYATHRAGIYQSVPVTPGRSVTFSIWAYVWSSAGDDPDVSTDPGDYRVSVGIDPTGGTDGDANSVVWSEPCHAYDEWVALTVTAVAQAPTITVFTRGEPVWRTKHNDVYWDDAALVVAPTGSIGAHGTTLPTGSDGLVPGKARVLSEAPPGASALAHAASAPRAIPTPTAGRRPVGNVPHAARAPRALGSEAALSYAGPHLSLSWQRTASGVTIEARAPQAIMGALALWHEGQEVTRWPISVLPGDALRLHWSGEGLNRGEMGITVTDSQGRPLARCGVVPQETHRPADGHR
jgi:hypothetical protein